MLGTVNASRSSFKFSFTKGAGAAATVDSAASTSSNVTQVAADTEMVWKKHEGINQHANMHRVFKNKQPLNVKNTTSISSDVTNNTLRRPNTRVRFQLRKVASECCTPHYVVENKFQKQIQTPFFNNKFFASFFYVVQE